MSLRNLLFVLCTFGLASLLPACDAAPPLPEGTVATVNGVPILASEVDAQIDALLDIEPAFVPNQRRRLIMTHIAIPRAYGIALAGERRAQARQAAEAWVVSNKSESTGMGPPGPIEPTDQGRWGDLGLATWIAARDLETGESSDVVELCGRFVVIKLLGRDLHPQPGRELLELEVESFPYDDSPFTLVSRCQTGILQIIDPAWNEVIPGSYKYSMRGKK